MFERLRLAWHVLCGRPLIYRIEFEGTQNGEFLHLTGAPPSENKNMLMVGCSFKGVHRE